MNIFKNCYTFKKVKFPVSVIIILWFCSNLLHAQILGFEAQKILEQSISIQKSGMLVLGSWATFNILSGVAGTVRYKEEKKYFFQMNAAWNTINLGIAAFGLFGAMNTDLSLNSTQIFSELNRFDRILLINAGLDLGYIGTGIYLWKRGLKQTSSRLTGYGKSIVLQGGFLFLFDSILYLIHHPQTNKIAISGTEIAFQPTGFSIFF